jgi:NAD(P)-dependent dehydrogenase (short-subunit alcohol dehydrogenase family)
MDTTQLDLKGQQAVVSGASSGIGYQTALELASCGCRVIALARRKERLKKLAAESGSSNLIPLVLDVSQPDMTSLHNAVKDQGVDILIHNAGFIEPAPLQDTSLQNWLETMDVNVTAAFYLYRNLHQHFNQGIRIANVSSLAGFPGAEKFPTFGAYTAAKSALSGLTETMAAELKELSGRANAICPGAVDTDMLRKAAPHLKAGLTPADVARHLLWLVNPASAPQTGQLIALY